MAREGLVSQTAINLAKVTQDAIRRQQRRIKEMEADPDHNERELTDAYKVLAMYIGQMRALTKDAIRWAQALNPEQVGEVIDGWFESLPAQQQKLRLQSLTRIHNGERQSA